MFTGLVEETGRFVSLSSSGKLIVRCSSILDDLRLGDSVAVNGTCLTVTAISGQNVSFHVSQTTNNVTNLKLGKLHPGQLLNLERALAVGDRLGGHLVSGHVDGLARIIGIDKQGADHFFEFQPPTELRKYIAAKGSVTIDGISLTVAWVGTSSFRITVIPATIENTNLKERRVGDYVHIEIDMIARYVEQLGRL
ncbi:MAG: riboflavin synthase [Spirochaetales bacterium]|nr:riboflavin synthase [Spirochaetales bacterium]